MQAPERSLQRSALAVAESGLKVTSFFRGGTSVGKALVNNECDLKEGGNEMDLLRHRRVK